MSPAGAAITLDANTAIAVTGMEDFIVFVAILGFRKNGGSSMVEMLVV